MSKLKSASLGQMLKREGFLALMERIKKLSEKEYKDLVSTNEDKPVSELNQLVCFVPDFFYIKTDEGKNTSIIQDGVYDFLEWAFENGAQPNVSVKHGVSVFLKSAQLKDADLLKYFVDNIKNLDIQQKDGRGQDILMHSVLSNSEEVLQYILSTNEFDINKQYILLHSKTVLHAACGAGNEAIIDLLLENGADLTILDDYENEPASMIPTKNESPLSEEETTEEKVQQWEDLYVKLEGKTKQALENKKNKKIYKTSF